MQQSLLGRLLLLGGTLLHAIAAVTYNCSASESCGCSANPAVLSRIVGGEQAGSRTWGWAASLRYATTDSHFCGGSIISAWHILTAAHCIVQFNSPSLLRVNVGSVYAASAPQTRSVAKIYKHPAYSPSTDRNDIAMLKLTSALDLDQAGVDLVCLPNVSSTVLASQEYPAAGQSVMHTSRVSSIRTHVVSLLQLVAIGWGVTAAGNTWTSSTLQQVTVQAVAASSSYCRRMQLQDVSTQFCAGVMPQGGKGNYLPRERLACILDAKMMLSCRHMPRRQRWTAAEVHGEQRLGTSRSDFDRTRVRGSVLSRCVHSRGSFSSVDQRDDESR